MLYNRTKGIEMYRDGFWSGWLMGGGVTLSSVMAESMGWYEPFLIVSDEWRFGIGIVSALIGIGLIILSSRRKHKSLEEGHKNVE